MFIFFFFFYLFIIINFFGIDRLCSVLDFLFYFFGGGGLLGLFSSSVFWVSMVGSTEVRVACPSISFLFACLGDSLGVSYAFLSLIEDFVFQGSSLSAALADLVPLLCQ